MFLCDLCGEKDLGSDLVFGSNKKKVFSVFLCDLCGERGLVLPWPLVYTKIFLCVSVVKGSGL